jgi:hypothetical protein
MRIRHLLALGLLLMGATAPSGSIRIDTWDTSAIGPLSLSLEWQPYPRSASAPLKSPLAIVVDGGRRALRMKTDHESVKIWREVRVGVNQTPRLVWEWKALALPDGGDVRTPTRNDQAARIMVLFEGWKAILYVWDTMAPVGTEVRPEEFALVDRALVVVRSGPAELGQWRAERRDVRADYLRLFGAQPKSVKGIGLEGHSDDTESQSEVLFGMIRFER